jgi:hypothetical protein
MGIDFPSAPTLGQKFPVTPAPGFAQYTWDGEKWTTSGSSLYYPYVAKAGDTMTGPLVLSADPTAALGAVTKQYSDGKVAKTGDTMTGPLIGPKANLFGSASGTAASGALTAADANIQLYYNGPSNWCGIGTDVPGEFWIRTGVSGTPAAALVIDSSQNVSGLAIASAAQYVANTPKKLLTTDQVWAAAGAMDFLTTSPFTPDFNATLDHQIALSATATAATMSNPVNMKIGQKGVMYIYQDGTGGRTITTWGSAYLFPGGVKPVLSTAGGAIDMLSFVVRTTSQMLCTFQASFG